MTHVMLDLETLGTAPGCAVLSIGAVAFDPQRGTMGSEFYSVIDLKSCLDAGLKIEAGTWTWWMGQGDAARAAVTKPGEVLAGVLTGFSRWFGHSNGVEIWCHGANFDEPILAAAYRACGITVPWKYWSARDTRTLFALFDIKVDRADGTHHHALDDSKAQARKVVAAYQRLALT